MLCNYFSYPGSNIDAARNTVFMNLFPDTHRDRSRLLVKLVSISISTRSKPVLSAAGIWMQQLGCTSSYSLELAKGIVDDYFILVPEAVERLRDLPQLAPQFTANFLTAVAELYSGKGEVWCIYCFKCKVHVQQELFYRWSRKFAIGYSSWSCDTLGFKEHQSLHSCSVMSWTTTAPGRNTNASYHTFCRVVQVVFVI